MDILCSDSCQINICQNGYHNISLNTQHYLSAQGIGGGGRRYECEGEMAGRKGGGVRGFRGIDGWEGVRKKERVMRRWIREVGPSLIHVL